MALKCLCIVVCYIIRTSNLFLFSKVWDCNMSPQLKRAQAEFLVCSARARLEIGSNSFGSSSAHRVLRLLHEIRDDISEQNAVRNELWVTFPRQEQAISYQKEHSNVFIFSYQDHVNGQRRFVVSSYKEFWRRYKNMNPKYRHHYEVIQEGLPCHLYFDLEFNKIENSNNNGEEMVDILLSLVFDFMNEKYSIEGDKECVVELDSSTEEKFSRHIIICFPNTAFKNNRHAGAFVGEICSRIQNERGRDGRFEKLFILKDRNSSHVNKEVFIDRAVYSRNRCFRLPLSSKARKTSILVPTGRFKCRLMSEEDMFMASLICKVDVDVQKILICEMDIGCSNTLQFATQVHVNFHKDYGVPRNLLSNSCIIDSSRIFQTGRSLFPLLDITIINILLYIVYYSNSQHSIVEYKIMKSSSSTNTLFCSIRKLGSGRLISISRVQIKTSFFKVSATIFRR
ncbi:hypothetical protein DCAR_0205694 [Daucus carota subsp. sativus]|uniref:DNA-directed primase/polymerase protein n=1 Tax=Daucus carota subsp. sativus TaxID=79200 RepID=A0AAF0WEC7_DAUCS|nr:hypothetical protein DCAR_0205694 [Daucus carota subsp. sativus]